MSEFLPDNNEKYIGAKAKFVLDFVSQNKEYFENNQKSKEKFEEMIFTGLEYFRYKREEKINESQDAAQKYMQLADNFFQLANKEEMIITNNDINKIGFALNELENGKEIDQFIDNFMKLLGEAKN